jgi:hypothetical protein
MSRKHFSRTLSRTRAEALVRLKSAATNTFVSITMPSTASGKWFAVHLNGFAVEVSGTLEKREPSSLLLGVFRGGSAGPRGAARIGRPQPKTKFAADSPLERAEFELPVPRAISVRFRDEIRGAEGSG